MNSRRERKKQRTRQRLIEAAWQLFQEKGYEQTTVQNITEVADVAKSTFFNYFETKKSILLAIMTWRIDLLATKVLSADDVPDNALERIKVLMVAMVKEFSPEGELTSHLMVARVGGLAPHKGAHQLKLFLRDLIAQGQVEGDIRADVDMGLISGLLITCFFATAMRWWHATESFSLEEELVYSIEALMDGLGGAAWRSGTES